MALTEHAQWNNYFVDFLQEAPEATGEEADDAELEAPKVCLHACLFVVIIIYVFFNIYYFYYFLFFIFFFICLLLISAITYAH